jgi:nitrate reductase gamma subunit
MNFHFHIGTYISFVMHKAMLSVPKKTYNWIFKNKGKVIPVTCHGGP